MNENCDITALCSKTATMMDYRVILLREII